MFPGVAALAFLVAFVMEIAKFALGPVTPLAIAFLGLFFLALGGVPVVVNAVSRRG